jgi:hypothetical protein
MSNSYTVSDVLTWLERQVASNISYGSHSMAYETAANKLRGASDFIDDNKRPLMGDSHSEECTDCGGSGKLTGPRGGKHKCPSCKGWGEIYFKLCSDPNCGFEISSKNHLYSSVRCPHHSHS